MTRLDIWLVEMGHFASRQIAKRAIKSGLVRVDGAVCKPSKEINGTASIEILDELADNPMGFQKLRIIESRLEGQLVASPCLAVDIGSSAGGFLLYLASRGAQAIGVEVSPRFLQNLEQIVDQYDTVSVIIADAFELDPLEITGIGTADLLLIDVTTDYSGTLRLVNQFSCILKQNGRLIVAIKSTHSEEDIHRARTDLESLGYQSIEPIVLDDSREEFHISAIHW